MLGLVRAVIAARGKERPMCRRGLVMLVMTWAAAATAAALLAGCSSPAPGPRPRSPAADTRPKGGIVTVATGVAEGPDWIFPFAGPDHDLADDLQDFMDLMYRPLYLFGGNDDSVTVNYPLSPADPAAYGNGGRTVTITMKGWKWSNGEKVDAADVIFWLNLDEAEKLRFAGYVKGGLPDNLASYRASGPETVVLNLTRPYGSTWFTYNELAQITPMPQAWDISRTGAVAGSGGCERDSAADHWAKCTAVYKYLTAQSQDPHPAGYASPASVWSVVDGPWRLAKFVFNKLVTLVPNRSYSGSPKPALSQLRFVTYGTWADTVRALRAGQVDLATIPPQYLPAKPLDRSLPVINPAGRSNYLQPAYNFDISFYSVDFADRADRAMFSQLYFRQALQELTDQDAIARNVDGGYAIPTTAGVPNVPSSMWLTPQVTANNDAGLFPYDPARAESLLAAHGWTVVRGTLTCLRPGSLAGECGAGIKHGQKADLGPAAQWAGGYPPHSTMGLVRAGLAAARIHISVVDPETLVGPAPCSAPCLAGLQYVGGWAFNGPGYAPTGELLFQTGASWNLGLYSSAEMDSLISDVQASDSLSVFHAYANYTAAQLPVIWLPAPYSVVAVNLRLRGVTQSPLASLFPEYWYLTRPGRP